jgi:hypothetical protein
MPTRRMTNPPANSDPWKGPSAKATVLGAVGDNNNTFYVSVEGRIVSVTATIDAPLRVGDVVWVQTTPQGWILQGTA